MSSGLQALLIMSGSFAVALGIAHLWVPRIFAIDRAIGLDAVGVEGLGDIGAGRWRYARRRADAIGLAWVMSNAASYILLTVGVIDLSWAAGDRSVPISIGAGWIAGWWLLRAGGQFVVGRRRGDVAIAGLFAGLASVHLIVAVA